MTDTAYACLLKVFVDGYFRKGKWVKPSTRSSTKTIVDKYGHIKTKH